ncbi:MAG: DUF3794 domain-containing protein, partial [Clostridia bacterium]|nr:DUF3794 domain-containing protein [Clostridia bacterium]
MAFERNNFLVAKKVALPKGELSVECNLNAGCALAKVLSVAVDACVQGKEVVSGMINYSGAVDVKVIYLTEEGEIGTVSSRCPFSSKFEEAGIVAGGCAQISVNVIDYTCDLLGGDSIRISTDLMQSGFFVSSGSVSTLRCDEADVCYQTEGMEIIKFLGCANDTLTIESDINLRDNIKKILLTESKALVRTAESGANYVVLTGDVVSRVLYINENDKFESGYIYDSFKQEIELAGVTRDSLVEGYASVCQEGVATEIVQDERGGKLVVKTPINLTAFAFDKENVSVIKDLYATKAEVNITTESFSMNNLCGMEVVEGKIEGSLTIDEDNPRVDKILFSGASRVSVTNQYIQERELFIEGIAQTTVVYLNDDTSSLYSVVIDVPFVISDKTNCQGASTQAVNAILTDVDVVVKKGRELIFDAKVKATVVCCCDVAGAVISDASFGEEFGERDYAMEVIFAKKNSGLWETAKAARVREEQIVAQNPEVIFP